MTPRTTAHDTGSVAPMRVAGMAADLRGYPDGRPPLVLLPGLTFDRGIWPPVLEYLARIDPGRQVLALDLPGHGGSPDQLPHSMSHVVSLIRDAVAEAALDPPVLVGHSISGGLASLYAAHYPARGVVNVDALPDLAPFVRLVQSVAEQIRGDGFPAVWAMMEQSFRTDLLPAEARELVARNSCPGQALVASYWQELLEQTPDQVNTWLAGVMAAIGAAGVPYLLIAGAALPPGLAERIASTIPQATVEVWADTGHFPHLAHPRRFADRLAATARWTAIT
jgi:pimeloyl-ACP methyl ester carboxylesterase